jgi:hypothetical protein
MPAGTEIIGYRYETMVFPCDSDGAVTDWGELACNRYDSEAEARAGHAAMCAEYQNNTKETE